MDISIYPFSSRLDYLVDEILKNSKLELKYCCCYDYAYVPLKKKYNGKYNLKNGTPENIDKMILESDCIVLDRSFDLRALDDTVYFDQLEAKIRASNIKLIIVGQFYENEMNDLTIEDIISHEPDEVLEMKGINLPTILIATLFPGMNSFEAHLKIKDGFNEFKGNILHIGSSEESSIFGIDAIPKYFFSKEIPDNEKILLLNNEIKRNAVKTSAEMIVMSSPTGLIPFSKECIGDFGIISQKICKVIRPNFIICVLPYLEYELGDLQYYFTKVREETGLEIDFFILKNVVIDRAKSMRYRKGVYLPIKHKTSREKVKSIDIPYLLEITDNQGIRGFAKDFEKNYLLGE